MRESYYRMSKSGTSLFVVEMDKTSKSIMYI